MRIRAEKDFWAGLIYATLAVAFLWFGKDYRWGTASRMGPGYFPLTLGWLLLGFGIFSIGRAFLTDGPRLSGISWRKLGIITASIVSFGVLMKPLGLVAALPVLVAISALASRESRYDLRSLFVLVGLTLFCILVFVKGLGVPLPIFGEWFDGIVPASWQR